MPKMKTKSAAAKRFKVTKTGKVKFKRANKRHILSKKSPGRKLRLRKGGMVHESSVVHVQATMPYAF